MHATSLRQENQTDTPLGRSINDSALKAGVGRSTIRGALNSGALTARKIGRRTVILDADLQSWLAALPAYEARS
jgi:Mrp family chromosome partitioning ATPase